MTAIDRTVLVAGGGLAGLALTRALLDRNHVARSFERRPLHASEGLAMNLPGNAIAALSRIGFKDEISTLGRPIRRREYRTDTDRLLFSVDEDGFWPHDARPRAVRRDDLARMLAGSLPPAAMRRGVNVRHVTVFGNRVELTLSDGTTDIGGLLVGADGVNSTVRKAVFAASTAPASALLAPSSWRFMAPNPGVDCWTVWAGARGTILLMPLDDTDVYGWIALSPDANVSDPLVRLETFARRLPPRVRTLVEALIREPDSLRLSPMEEVRLEHWVGHRVALIGDAAHATAPVWAQGVALAIEDAVVLSDCLADSADMTSALTAYQERRRSRVGHVQAMTDRMSRAARLPSTLRNLLMPFIGPRAYANTYGPLRGPA